MVEYKDVYISLLRFCADIASALNPNLAPDKQLTALNFDGTADLSTLPQGDLVGISHWTLAETANAYGFYCHCMFGFRVINDDNLMRLETVYIDYLIKLIKTKDYKIPIYKAGIDIEQIIGHLQFSEVFETFAPKQNDGSVFRMVGVTLLSPQHLLVT